MKVTPELLHQVQIDNIREHQIGEIEDGVSWDVAKDLGFVSTEQVVELAKGLDNVPEEVTPSRQLTIAEKNANERRHIAETRRRFPKNRRGR